MIGTASLRPLHWLHCQLRSFKLKSQQGRDSRAQQVRLLRWLEVSSRRIVNAEGQHLSLQCLRSLMDLCPDISTYLPSCSQYTALNYS